MSADCDTVAAAEFLRALAHPMRLQILCRLLDGELSVGGFETELGLKQPSLSQQLAALRQAELVETRREAKSIFYRLTDGKVPVVMDALRQAFSAAPSPREAPASKPAPIRASPATPKRRAQGGECGVFAVIPMRGASAACSG